MVREHKSAGAEIDFSSELELFSRRGAPLWRKEGRLAATSGASANQSGTSEPNAQRRIEMLQEALGLPANQDISARCELSGVSARELEIAFAGETDTAVDELLDEPEIFRLTMDNDGVPPGFTEHVPFESLLAPIARRICISFFDSREEEVLSLWSPEARQDLYRELLSQIVQLFSHALLHELQVFRVKQDVGERAALAFFVGQGEKELYQEFLRNVTRDHGRAFYHRYPVLLRLLSIRVRNWRDNTELLLRSLQRDRLDLERHFGIARDADVEGVQFGLSDPHHGGRAVVILTVKKYGRIVFKPRSLAPDAAFMRVASHLNEAAGKQLFRIVSYLERQGYGWMEFLATNKVRSQDEHVDYYRRVGSLLALLHALRATDCHNENLFVVDGYPVMVDLETIAHPDYGLLGSRPKFRSGYFDFLNSVARVGLLPIMKSEEEEVDISAVGSALAPQTRPALRYQGVGSISLDLKDFRLSIDVQSNSPSDEPIDRDAVVAAIKSGFSEAYYHICGKKAELLKTRTLLPSLRSCEVRFVARPSRVYGWLLQRGQDAKVLRSGIDWSLEMERLYRVCMSSSIPKEWTRIADSERRALEALDIPRFTVPVTRRLIREGQTVVLKDAFARSPWQLVRARLKDMGPEDLATQLRIIELSFAQRGGRETNSSRRFNSISRRSSVPNRHSRVIDKSRELIKALEDTMATPSRDGGAWVTLSPMTIAGEYRLESAGPGLYQGNAGIGLFIAAAYSIDPIRRYRDLARDVLHGLIRYSDNYEEQNRPWDIGIGRAGISYALFRGGYFLKDKALQQAAYELIVSVDDETLKTTDQVDVISGLAGYILVAELISHAFPHPVLLRKMALAANRVCQLEQVFSENQVAWATLEGKPLPGFAHGSSGISYALTRAGARLGAAGRTLLSTARRTFLNESYVFDATNGNWRDLRGDLAGFTAPSWCHGAVGIGLAAAGCAKVLSRNDHEDIAARSLAVVEFEVDQGLEVHSLCCGAPGILEYLMALPAPSQDRGLMDRVREHLLNVGAYKYFDRNESRCFLPGMFVGGAGVGYQLLRTEFPERVPSILTFS
jgi:type 2 lantibiotic biosynthesis protein LanM